MRYPEFLKKNGTIGVTAPSFGAVMEPYRSEFKNAIRKFGRLGYSLDIGSTVYEASGIGISSAPKKCGEELVRYYCSTQNDVVISCGGGELMCEALKYVDFDSIKAASPKWYMGYSDNTNFTFPLTTGCEVASIYASCAPTFGMEPWHDCLQDDMDILTGASAKIREGQISIHVKGYEWYETERMKDEEHPLTPYNCTEPSVKKLYLDGTLTTEGTASMEGRLIGGCLDILCMHVGTSFDHVKEFNEKYKKDGIIWFLESCDQNPMAMRRALWQMEHAGWFQYVKGFLIGRPLYGNEPLMGLDSYMAYCGILEKYNVPIMLDMDFGHVPPAMPVIAGSIGRISFRRGKVEIEYRFR